MNVRLGWCLLVVLLSLFAGRQVDADTVTLAPVADTTLFEHDPNNNLGVCSTMAVGTTAGVSGEASRSRALIKFDVAASIPTNATVTSAKLTIKVTKTPSPSRVDSIFDLRRMLQSWKEGTKNGDTGSPAATGETTWRARFNAATPVNATLWQTPGGGTNTDFSATVSASTMVRGLGTYTFASTPELVADLQAWLQDTNSNQGWILMSQSERTPRTARRIGARERTAADRSSLAVEFTVPTTSTPPQLQSPARSGDTFTFVFAAEANRAYTVEFADALPATSWQSLANIAAQPTAHQVTISDGSVTSMSQRFYRVRVP